MCIVQLASRLWSIEVYLKLTNILNLDEYEWEYLNWSEFFIWSKLLIAPRAFAYLARISKEVINMIVGRMELFEMKRVLHEIG